MALTDEGGNGLIMPVAPMYGGSNGGNSGWGGDNGWWILLLFILLAGRGWGGYGNGMTGGSSGDGSYLYPWMNQAQITTEGFQNAQISGQIDQIQNGVQGLSTQLCNCCADMTQTVTGGFANAETAANARQIANMQQAFANQTAMNQGFNSIQSQFAQCCCDNRLATEGLKYTIATENCADRAAISDGIRDILTAQTANTQRILDQLCQDKIDEKNDTIAQLRQEVLYARGQASQDVQTARLLAGQTSEVDALYNRLSQCPVPCMPVYGMTPIFTCNNNSGCGCGGNF